MVVADVGFGSWASSPFGLCSTLSLLGSLWPGGRLEYLFRRSWFGKLTSAVGCLVGFFVASYTGALLTATNQPIWSDSVWIAPLFLTSAASTGIAAILLIARGSGVAPAPLERLNRLDQWALGLELAFFLVFLGSLGAFVLPMLAVPNGLVFVFGTLLVGILAPLLLHGRATATGGRGIAAAAFLALVGGFLMRYGILTTPPMLLEHPQAVAARFGPEDGRPRGGGAGADPGNHGAKVEPPSKITGTR